MDSVERALARVEGRTLAAGWLSLTVAAWAGVAWLAASAARGADAQGSGLRSALLSALTMSFLLALIVAPLHRASNGAARSWRAGDPEAGARARSLAAWGIPITLLGTAAAVAWGLMLAWRPFDLQRNQYRIDYFVEGGFTVPGAMASLLAAGLLLALLPPLFRLARAGAPEAPRGIHRTHPAGAARAAGPLASACRATLVAIQVALPLLAITPIAAYASQDTAEDHGMGGALVSLWTLAGLGVFLLYAAYVTGLLRAATRLNESVGPAARGRALAFLATPVLAGAASVSLYGAVAVASSALADGVREPAVLALEATSFGAAAIIAASSLTLLVMLARLLPAGARRSPPAPEVARA